MDNNTLVIPRTKGLVSSRRKLKRDGDKRRKEWGERGKRTRRSIERICHNGFCGFILMEEESDSVFNLCF